jgi:hypothetical protein
MSKSPLEQTVPLEAHLGDGLYASFDGFSVTLRAPREDGDHWVALEPMVVAALLEFLADRFQPNEALVAAAKRYRERIR